MDRSGEMFFRVFGPPTVDDALQGHHPQAREQWKQLAEANRRDRQEERRRRAAERDAR
jgi:hypothetical protein